MAKVKTIYSAEPLNARQATDKLLLSIRDERVLAELQKWLHDGLTGSGSTLYELSSEQLALFLDKLPDLLLALYCQQQEDQKGERP